MASPSGLTALLEIEHPLIQAPMAGGITNPALVSACSRSGILGSLGAALLSPEQIADASRDIRQRTDRPFAVNLFVPSPIEDGAHSAEMLDLLGRYHAELGLPPPTPPAVELPDFDEQVEALVSSGASVFSFTFGIPPARTIERAKARGLKVIGTATTVAEATLLESAGVDDVVAQGAEAGGHRGTFAGDFESSCIGTMALVPLVVDAVRVPVIAAGGIMDGRGIVAALALGASAVQMGTAFLRCTEAGTPRSYREAMRSAREADTVLTRAFTGRPARSIKNRFSLELAQHPEAILPFPLQQIATRHMRLAAAERGDAGLLPLWAGQGVALSRDLSAGALIAELVSETRRVRARL